MYLGQVLLPDSLYVLARRILGRTDKPAWLDTGLLNEAGVNLNWRRDSRSHGLRGRRVVETLASSLQRRGLPALLRHGDRNSMRFSVESRVPFLTTKLAQTLLSMPEEYLMSNSGETKSIFRAAMRGIVPDLILDRKDKIGFETPEREWLSKIAPQIRKWIEGFNVDVKFINKVELLKAFDAVIEGRVKFSWQLWRWVNFIRWVQLTNQGSLT